MPKTFPGSFDFANLSIAKISADGKTLQIARPKIQNETRMRGVTKTVMQKVSMTKTVSDGGVDKTEIYEESVPMTITEEQAYIVRVPSGFDRFDVAMDKVSAFNLLVNPIDRGALAARLQKPTYVLAMEGDVQAIDPFYVNALRADMLIIFLPPGTIPAPAPAPTAPAPTAPAPPAPPAPAPTR
jgi:hypothetical protein